MWLNNRTLVAGPLAFIFGGLFLESVIGLPNWGIWLTGTIFFSLICFPWENKIFDKIRFRRQYRRLKSLHTEFVKSPNGDSQFIVLREIEYILESFDIVCPEILPTMDTIYRSQWSEYIAEMCNFMLKGNLKQAKKYILTRQEIQQKNFTDMPL